MQDGTWLLNLSHAGLASPQKSKLSMMTVSDGDAKAVVQTSSAVAASSVQLPTSRIILVWKPKEATEKSRNGEVIFYQILCLQKMFKTHKISLNTVRATTDWVPA